ncbi:Guanylate cyclase domain-containing protein [Sulfidibacter corallicola]|uniref:Guanylate cyclase domain-containing protein n=1 Tax=Sulfidibacter corallicola TaxID=2818388 RepID=A0A8A4TNB9_SULCO|nr:adenylate/guanylate cyclase domain-containing protein [Sulfidibacter corallicola]QTD50391.1 hypothetical protein J3U87_32810 [Sulfidibacter corallicola]
MADSLHAPYPFEDKPEIPDDAMNDSLSFVEENDEPEEEQAAPWTILIVDDEPDVHQVTRLALSGTRFSDRGLQFVNAYSAAQAAEILGVRDDIAVALIDVVMEREDAGLWLVRHIREDLGNKHMRLVLRTGQPGYAPETQIIQEFDINDYKTKTELTAQKLFNTVLVALRSFKDIRELELTNQKLQRLITAYSRFVPHQFLAFLHKESITQVKLGDQIEREMTVLFSDIRDFTQLSELMTPRENFRFINSYLGRMEPIIGEHGGFIDKYIGDAIMALFPNSADAALSAALHMLRILTPYNEGRARAGYPPIRIGIGLHTGSLMLGTVGGENRMDHTVISQSVNLASRIESATKIFDSGCLITGKTHAQLKDPHHYQLRLLDRLVVKGKNEPVTIYEAFDADPEPVASLKRKTLSEFQEAIHLFREGRYHRAHDLFSRICRINPADRAAQLYVERCGTSTLRNAPSL